MLELGNFFESRKIPLKTLKSITEGQLLFVFVLVIEFMEAPETGEQRT